MTGGDKPRRLLCFKDFFDVIGVPAHTLQEQILPPGVVIGHRRLHQMTGAIELVGGSLLKPLLRFHHGEPYVEVAVRPLMRGDLLHRLIDHPFQPGIFFLLQDVGGGLYPFRHIGIIEDVGLMRVAGLPIEPEGGKPAGFLKAPPNGINGRAVIEGLPLLPKSAVEGYGGKIHALQMLHRNSSLFSCVSVGILLLS